MRSRLFRFNQTTRWWGFQTRFTAVGWPSLQHITSRSWSKYLKARTVQDMSRKTERDHPFRPPRQLQLVEDAEQLLREWAVGRNAQPAEITTQTWLSFKASVENGKCWYTQHMKMGEASKACLDQWRILGMWESWEGGQRTKPLSWRERLNESLRKYPHRPPKGKRQGRTNKVSNSVEAFKKRCGHMGLERGTVPLERRNRSMLRRFASK
jgi:hypothetical protein